MKTYECRKCHSHMSEYNSVEVFAYDVWILCKKCEKEFYAFVESFFQPERSKREESGYKYCYKLYDCAQESIQACNTSVGVVFSKEEAQSWVDHGINRAYHEHKVCKVFPDMRCSEHCGNTVRDK